MTNSLFDLTGKVAVVTGGNGGIGIGLAKGLAQAGATVSIWGTNVDKNEQAAATLEPLPGRVITQQCNVADEDQVQRAFAETLASCGRIDGCFANAGVGGRGIPFDETTREEWRRVTDVNLDGVFFTFKHAVAHMKQRALDGDPGGRLIATSSLSTIFGLPRSEHYAATKGALIAMVKGLTVEYARYGVTAHSILPGFIDTAMTEELLSNEKFVEVVMRRIPLRRWGVPDDFSAIAVYLMSDASAYHTGDTFVIDGGLSKY